MTNLENTWKKTEKNREISENTKKILEYYSKISATAPAAEYCDDFSSGGFSDWYLPSAKELSIIKPKLWDKYGSSVMSTIDLNWTSNTHGSISYMAASRYYNGCSGSAGCDPNQPKDSELYVIPIRKF